MFYRKRIGIEHFLLSRFTITLFVVLLLQFSAPLAIALDISVGGKAISVVFNEKTELCILYLNREVISTIDCLRNKEPEFIKALVLPNGGGKGIARTVVVLHQNSRGTACGSGPLTFINFGNDLNDLSDVDVKTLDYCGEEDPIIKQQGDLILITLPGGQLMRHAGTLRSERWIYKNRAFSKVK